MIELRTDLPLPDGVDVEVASDQQTLVATDGGRTVGAAVWRLEGGLATVAAIVGTPGADRDTEVLDAVRRRAAGAGLTTLVAEIGSEQTALLAAVQDATVLSRYMVKPVPTTAPELPRGFGARDMRPDEYGAWRQLAVEEYAVADLARSGGDRALALQRSLEAYARFLPDGAATADTRLLTLTLDGAPAGDLWVRHHRARHREDGATDQTFTFDVEVAQAVRGRGLGRAAMLVAERAALEVGDRQLGLNVFGDNLVATGLYRSLGYHARSTVFDVPLGS